MSLRDLKKAFFRLKMDFNEKEKSHICMIRYYQIGKKIFDRIKNKFQNAKNNNLKLRTFG